MSCKLVFRIYRELELNLRIKPKCRIKRGERYALIVPTRIKQGWSMDFSLSDVRSLRAFKVAQDYIRECLTIDVGFSKPGLRVMRVMAQVIERRVKPEACASVTMPQFKLLHI